MGGIDIRSAETAARLLASNNVGVWSFEMDPDRPPRMYANAEMARLLGIDGKQLTPEEIQRTWYDSINPAYRKLVDDAVSRMIEGLHAEVVFPWIHPVEGEIWVRCSGRRDYTYAKGIRIEGLQRDITDLVQFRRGGYRPEGGVLPSEISVHRPATASNAWQAEESLELWREIADSFQSMIFIKDVDDEWRYCYSNARHHDFVGMDPTGKNDIENFGVENGSKWHAEDLKMFETGRSFNDNGTYFSFCEGDRFYNMRKFPLTTKTGHRYVVGVGADITDLYLSHVRSECLFRVHEALFAAENEKDYVHRCFSAVLNSVSWVPRLYYRGIKSKNEEICLCSDGRGNIQEAKDTAFSFQGNAAWQRYLQSLKPGETRLCTDVTTIVPECKDLGLHACLCFPVVMDGAMIGYAAVFTNRRGPTSDYADALAKLISEVITYAVHRWETQALIQDLERQKEDIAAKRLEEARAAERSKSLFLASMSHEIRTPLNAVIGLSQELQNDDLLPEQRNEHLRSISTASRALLDLINDVLDISKLESGHLKIERQETDVRELTRSSGTIFADALARRNLYLKVQVPEKDILVSIDPHRVRQILLNLLGNATKFTHAGGVTLSCTCSELKGGYARLVFSVADTGIGIAEEDQPRVFGMFEQASGLRGTRVANAGTGLGLALCQRLASMMKGEIKLSSELGKGSTFTLEIPHVPYRILTADERVARTSEAPQTPRTAFTGKVLIVDDVALNLKVLGIMLKREGVTYVAANSCSTAIKAMEKETFDVLLTDLWMPDMSGEALAKHVRNDPRHANMRIAAVTADIDVGSTFDTACFDAILPKPITQSILHDFLVGKKA